MKRFVMRFTNGSANVCEQMSFVVAAQFSWLLQRL
jgi:hypothetical protein